ncbi:MAG TPA: hypothetical protein VNN79_19440 [Actinomycetota bacterium]|nr:hypothetical protein [Actinomycetota bacterium]
MRRRPSVATVLAALALFVSLSGTAVAASVIITKNSQVAPHVIAGAAAATGVKQNLVLGSVGTGDLHARAVTTGKVAPDAIDSTKVADGSLTGDDISGGSIPAGDLDLGGLKTALKLVHVLSSALAGGHPTLHTAGIFTMTGECVDDGAGSVHAQVVISAQVSSLLSVNGTAGEEFFSEATTPLAQTPSSAGIVVRGGDFTAQSGNSEQFVTGRVMAWTFGGTCGFRFDGTSEP